MTKPATFLATLAHRRVYLRAISPSLTLDPGEPIRGLMASELRVEKERMEATVTMSNGTSVRGYVFVSSFSATHSGPERVKDVLNDEARFFPFEPVHPAGRPTVLFNRDHVVMVDLASDEELRQTPGYEHATRHAVSMLLSNGQRIDGMIRVVRPIGRDRLSDHARAGELFWYLEGRNHTLIVNSHHILELTDVQA